MARKRRTRHDTSAHDWASLLDRTDVLILDTETTGLDEWAQPVTVAVIDTTGRTRFNELVMPTCPISKNASAIHGLTKQKLRKKGARGWPAHAKPFARVIKEATLVLVYNLAYDRRVIRQAYSIHDLRSPTIRGRCIMLDYAAHRRIPGRYGDWKWHKLDDACRHEGLPPQGQIHDALADCRAVLALMQKVSGPKKPKKTLRQKKPTAKTEVAEGENAGCGCAVIVFVLLIVGGVIWWIA